ncbi:alkene reductase [Saccharopolyspora phatthalungensis]|uniref:N-ethylmaleimide reductase n=1 Tax=Saccharopolyspora phatthalungensis TaxID=664693 RepID=A0A840QH99_9PSEU|nr:alkene reductase [Saccharopolyspora phatthalungensis]MBB5158019.1 N-ethylmaleimide reductase [Saccharopolyspora phatthalungensis]
MATLFDEVKLGDLVLPNRIVMAPLTRNRAGRDGVPGELAATYYAQRASAGLIIGEGSQPSAVGQGFFDTPGLHTAAHIAAWSEVTAEVHAAGGRIFAQLMHAGRIGHADLVAPEVGTGRYPVAPSPIRHAGQARTRHGSPDFPVPVQLTEAEISDTIRDFADAARNAMAAGFDGVELHGANGCLLHQFLADGTNRRTDRYGGSIGNRIRFTLEVTEAVAAEIGPDRVGLRISPGNRFNDMSESDTEELYPALLSAIAPLGIAFLHVYEVGNRQVVRALRDCWAGTCVLNPHPAGRTPVDLAAAQQVIDEGLAELVSFGRNFIANPDLPHRLRSGIELTEPDPSTFYGGDHRGYTDYPTAEG